MRAEVLAVGTELLLGDIVNGNAAWIGQALASIGIDCYGHTTVGDNEARIAEAMGAALARADALIVTGGLGPTQDDVTREAIARLTGRPLRRDEALASWLTERFAGLGRAMAASNLRQADVPEGARVIEQTFGTAPGLIVEHAGGVLYALPGVPAEMRDMMTRAVLPDLARRAGMPERIVSRVVRTSGVPESTVADALAPLWDSVEGVTMAFLAGRGEVRVRLTAKAADDDAARASLDVAEEQVRAVLGAAVVGADDDTLESVVLGLLGARGWTLATAESITAGWIAGRLAEVPGASARLRGGVVAYHDAVKTAALAVDPSLIERDGAVSEAVARAMAAGARAALGADVAVAATGVAGPEPLGDRAPGVVCFAVSGPLGEATREVRLPGDRNTVRALAAAVALNLVRLYLLEALPPEPAAEGASPSGSS